MPAEPARPVPGEHASTVAARTEVLARGAHRSSASFELALAPVLMALVGLVLDRTLGTTPLFIILLAVVGVAGASVKVIFGYRHQMAAHESAAPWSAAPSGEPGSVGTGTGRAA